MNKNTRNLAYAAVCLALCMILPIITMRLQSIGNMLSPMHIPVLLAGFLCGPAYALLVGVLAPLLRSLLFGMPPLFPTAAAMCFELLTYGLVSGLLFKMLPKSKANIYVSLIAAMLGLSGGQFTVAAFIAGAFTNAIPGIILHIVLIPLIVMALQRAGFIED